jgi:phenylacetic acid degradation operon negative regulatory protein
MVDSMKPRTEEFLNLLLWSADMLLRPTFRNLTRSYEGWAYGSGLLRRVATLEKQRLLERDSAWRDERIYRLTRLGRLHVLGGRDPEERWSRKWDGRWRLVIFDVPTTENSRRTRLRRYLRERGFGRIQNSVWITPDTLEEEKEILAGGKLNVGSMILFNALPCGGESDSEIVVSAWNFKGINARYKQHLKILDARPRAAPRDIEAAKALLHWATLERSSWLSAVQSDPLLPERILPPGYLGRRAWQRRVEVLREASRQLQTFQCLIKP